MKRLDVFLAEKGYFSSRSKAQNAISEGLVTVNGCVAQKPSLEVSETDAIEVSAGEKYVSRGAYKLIEALEKFGADPNGKVCIDIGASTGGFTQVLLENGAKKVFSVDVGSGQLADIIRNDPRVVAKDNTNCRYLTPEMFDTLPEFAVMDVSFISQALIYPALSSILVPGAKVIALVKPQFEAGRNRIGKNGIVRDPDGRIIADIMRVLSAEAEKNSLHFIKYIPSPIKGGDGNKEYLALFIKN